MITMSASLAGVLLIDSMHKMTRLKAHDTAESARARRTLRPPRSRSSCVQTREDSTSFLAASITQSPTYEVSTKIKYPCAYLAAAKYGMDRKPINPPTSKLAPTRKDQRFFWQKALFFRSRAIWEARKIYIGISRTR